MMTTDLRALFDEAQRIIKRERAARWYVFRDQPEKQAAKVGEMDRLMQIIVQIKDELKTHMQPDVEQATLLDVPKRGEY